MIELINPKTKKKLEKINKFYVDDDSIKFPIINNIVRFINLQNNIEYSKMWGEQWRKFSKTQLDSYTNKQLSKNRLEFILGGQLDLMSNKAILEVGSGAGRFTEIIAKYARELHTMDSSKAIDINQDNNNKFSNIHFYQADLFNIPFNDEGFDYVICLGVIQHTPNSEEAIKSLWKMVKPNGILLFDHYQFVLRHYLGLSELFRFFFKRMKFNQSLKIIKFMNDIFFPIFWHNRNNKFFLKVLKKIIPLGFDTDGTRNNLGYNTLKEWTYLDTHDALADPIKKPITAKSLTKIIKKLDNCKVELFSELRPGSNGLEVRLRRI